MTSIILQGFGSPLLAGQLLPATATTLRAKITDVVVRVAAFEASLAHRAAAVSEPGLAVDDDTLFEDDDGDASNRPAPSSGAVLGALGIAVSLMVAWLGMQII